MPHLLIVDHVHIVMMYDQRLFIFCNILYLLCIIDFYTIKCSVHQGYCIVNVHFHIVSYFFDETSNKLFQLNSNV